MNRGREKAETAREVRILNEAEGKEEEKVVLRRLCRASSSSTTLSRVVRAKNRGRGMRVR